MTFTNTANYPTIGYSSTAAFKSFKEIWRDAIYSIVFEGFKGSTLDIKSSADEAIFANLPNLVSAHLYQINQIKDESAGGFFSGCPSLRSVSFSKTLTEGTATLSGLKYLGAGNLNNMFEGCSIEKAVFSTTVIKKSSSGTSYPYVFSSMFKNCTSLKSITLPECITEIKSNAFYGCTALEEITIASTVATIGENAFVG